MMSANSRATAPESGGAAMPYNPASAMACQCVAGMTPVRSTSSAAGYSTVSAMSRARSVSGLVTIWTLAVAAGTRSPPPA